MVKYLLLAVVFLTWGTVCSSPLWNGPTASTCGYDSCNARQPGMINVHVVCHTHDDVGWLKTPDQYYYGDQNNIQNAGVQYILDSVIEELSKNPQRRFIYVETSFFHKWWTSRDDTVHQKVQDLVQSGQLEFINGGWCMNDEASNYYVDTIDQMTWGLRFLNDTFGPCGVPRVAWQIDPFGHSREQASIFAQIGFDGLFFGRLDHDDKDNRQNSRTMEFLWQASANLGIDAELFTGVLPDGYGAPSGFNFDIFSNDEPIRVTEIPFVFPGYILKILKRGIWSVKVRELLKIEQKGNLLVWSSKGSKNQAYSQGEFKFWSGKVREAQSYNSDTPGLKGNNVEQRVNDFLEQVYAQAEHYATDDLIMTMGGDFQYQDAHHWYLNLDKVIKYVNARQDTGSNVNVLYSTPSCYLKSLNEASLAWTIKTDDFFPYSSDTHSYWTGYFTSRSALKGYTKTTNNILQIAKQISSYANLGSENDENNLAVLKRFQGDAQHHDAVSGTSKQAVAFDYAQSLATGVDASLVSINDAYNNLLSIGALPLPAQTYCPYLNVSYCDATETQTSFVVTVYNPLGQEVKSHIRVPVTGTAYTVAGPDGTAIDSQVVSLPQQILDTPEKQGSATSDLVFSVDLPPSGLNSYFVQAAEAIMSEEKEGDSAPKADDLVIENEFLTVTVDGNTGLLTSIADVATGKVYNVQQNFYYYEGMSGDNHDADARASGAYIFRPSGTDVYPVGSAVTATLVSGTVVQEIQQTFGDYVSQIIRLYPGEQGVEFEWLVGPIPVDDGIGKEIISRFETDFATNSLFYTDANGREVLQRQLNYRPTWDYAVSEPIAGNYYPVNSRIYIQDTAQDSQLTVVTDRSEGGSSILDGSIELMVHRRLLHDDAFGVGEALNEPGVDGKGLIVRGKHRVLVNTISEAAPIHRKVGLQASSPPLVTIAPLTGTVAGWLTNFKATYSGLTAALPENVNLLTVEPWKDGTILIRLEHFLEQTDSPGDLSQAVTVNLQDLFGDFQITQATETTLGGHIWKQDEHRLNWNVQSTRNIPNKPIDLGDSLDVTLTPMQIRTFVVQGTYN